jgi:ankyrin repeat protein
MVSIKELLEQIETAIQAKNLSEMTTLLDSDAGKQLTPENIGMLLHFASQHFDPGCFKALLNRSNINLVTRNQHGWTAAHIVAYLGKLDAIILLGEHYLSSRKDVGFGFATATAMTGLSPDITSPIPNVLPFAFAKLMKHEQCAQKIEEYQTMFTHNLKTLPHILVAAMKGQEAIVTSLKEKGVSSEILTTHRMDGGVSLLMWASANNFKELVNYYLKLDETKGLVNVLNVAGQSPLLMAACKGFCGIYLMLKDAGANIDILLTYTFPGGNNIFHVAMLNNFEEGLEFLLTLTELHPLLDKPNEQGVTPMIFATFNRIEPQIKALREAQVLSKLATYRNADGESVLMIAINNGYILVANDFLTMEETKSLKDVPNNNGITPIVQAAVLGQADTVSNLNAVGIPLTTLKEFRNANGASALMLAVGQKANDGVIFLINLEETKSLVNGKNKLHQSPLLLAACGEDQHKFDLLSNAGADRTILTSYTFEDGSNVLQFAMKNNLAKLITFLTSEEVALLSEQQKKVNSELNVTQSSADSSSQASAELLSQLFSATSALSIQGQPNQQPDASLNPVTNTFTPILNSQTLNTNAGVIASNDGNARPSTSITTPSI